MRLLFFSILTLSAVFPCVADQKNLENSAELEIPRVGQEGVEAPVFLKTVKPRYPERAQCVKIQGYVILDAVFKKSGMFDQIQILRGLGKGHFGFENAAMASLCQCTFLPGKFYGEPADVRMTIKIDFLRPDCDTEIPIISWSVQNREDLRKEPKAYWRTEKTSTIPKTAVLTLPVYVHLDEHGECLDYHLMPGVLFHFQDPIDIHHRVAAVLEQMYFQPAFKGNASIPCQILLQIPIHGKPN